MTEAEKSESQKRIEALIEEQRMVAERVREKERQEQERSGQGDQG